MAVRRNDSRRRRTVLGESGKGERPAVSPETQAQSRPKGRKPAARRRTQRAYQAGALRRHQPKSTDWIPKRPVAVALFLGALGTLFALIAMAGWMAGQHAVPHGSLASRFSLQSSGSLSVWCSTVLLLASALASLQIRALREHRSNDYRGTYRVWYWFAAILLLGSVNCVLDLGSLAAVWMAGTAHSTSQATLVIVAQLTALTLIVVRGAVEVRHSPASLAAIILVWLAYGGAMVMRLPGLENRLVHDDGFSACGLDLLGAFLTFAAVTLYARFVYLRANGLEKARRRAKRRSIGAMQDAVREKSAAGRNHGGSSRQNESTDDESPSHAADQSGESGPTAQQSRSSSQQGAPLGEATRPERNTSTAPGQIPPRSLSAHRADDRNEDDRESYGAGHRLSRAERKRLRKQQPGKGMRRAA